MVISTREPSPAGDPATRQGYCVLVFDEDNLLAVRRSEEISLLQPSLTGLTDGNDDLPATVRTALADMAGEPVALRRVTSLPSDSHETNGRTGWDVFFAKVERDRVTAGSFEWLSLEELSGIVAAHPESVAPLLQRILPAIEPHLIEIPYLGFAEHEYIYRFRTEDQRNRGIYASDERARGLYQSRLCAAIKAAKRQRERTAATPAILDFGAVRYVLPSHFGFCLGVQNAIERAYETIAENPGRRVYMISELIHNPFVNEDLRARGLIYLQSDRGEHCRNPETGRTWWEEIGRGDIVLTPAFGATDEDKVKLIRKGVAVNRYDATCMLVEKVWKAGRRFARAGYTVIIHGKSEHEETKATFSNCAKYGPSIIVRDRAEAEVLGQVILAPTRAEKERLFATLPGRHTPGFDPERDLERVAVVNQTTLLRNETLGIIEHLEEVMRRRYGPEEASSRLHLQSRGDTLCYATQVNQDALQRAIQAGADAAIVVGGRNSSNTFQLFRLCEASFGARAYYVQSERNIRSRARIEHYIFPYKPGLPGAGHTVERDFLPDGPGPFTILLTGGASCPDGIIQQIITRINGFFADRELRSLDEVVAEIED